MCTNTRIVQPSHNVNALVITQANKRNGTGPPRPEDLSVGTRPLPVAMATPKLAQQQQRWKRAQFVCALRTLSK